MLALGARRAREASSARPRRECHSTVTELSQLSSTLRPCLCAGLSRETYPRGPRAVCRELCLVAFSRSVDRGGEPKRV